MKECVSDSQGEVDRYVQQYGENYRPANLQALRETVTTAYSAIKDAEEYLRTKQSEEPTSGAVWVDLSYRRWGLKAPDGELLAEVRGTYPPEVYEYKGRRFYGEDAAKKAAVAAIKQKQTESASVIQQRDDLLAAMIEARESLQFAHDCPWVTNCAIKMMHRPETMLEFIDAAIAKVKQEKACRS